MDDEGRKVHGACNHSRSERPAARGRFRRCGDHGRGIFRRRDGGDRRRGARRSDTFGQAALCSAERATGAVQQGSGRRCAPLEESSARRSWKREGKPRVATPQPATERENLAGLVERVTFHNEDSGFCVLRVKARGQRDLITVVGHAAAIGAGEFVQASGRWVNDRTHGVQFRADFLRAAPPTTAEGIEKYLASGMIKGIGPIYAKKLVKAFQEQVFDVIEQTPARLAGGRRHRPEARRQHRRRLGRSEGDPRDHDLPAQPRRRHVAGGAHLQDLRRRRHPADLGEPVPPGARHPRHRLQERRSDRRASSASRRRR